MHSEFVNYLPELGRCDLFLMHVQRVLIACFVFLHLQFHGDRFRDKYTEKTKRAHSLDKHHNDFLELHLTPACNISIPKLAPKAPAITAPSGLWPCGDC